MNVIKYPVGLCLGSLLLVVAFSVSAQTAAVAPSLPVVAMDRAQLEKRLDSVKTLLEKSSAAKQIEASGDPAALAQRAQALDLWNQAKSAVERGDLEVAQKLLVDAPKLMFAAARLAAPEQILGDKLRSDYNNRRDSVKALLQAQKRISDEKGNVAGAEDVARNIEAILSEADQLASAGKFEQARVTVDKAYLVAKAAVGQMRSGDTLIRSLTFANKEEEYKYELDRNDSLAMLYKVLIEQAGRSNSVVEKFVQNGLDLRGRAEKKAAEGDHASGIKLLEESTSQLVRAIRGAGIYIPG
jgi:hypothetical protein